MTFFPPPKLSLRSRSSGATSPTLGQSATGIGGGGGDSHGWTVRGSALTDIQAGHFVSDSSSSSESSPGTVPGGAFLFTLGPRGFGLGSGSDDVKLKLSLDRPIFLRAILVVRLVNMLNNIGPIWIKEKGLMT